MGQKKVERSHQYALHQIQSRIGKECTEIMKKYIKEKLEHDQKDRKNARLGETSAF